MLDKAYRIDHKLLLHRLTGKGEGCGPQDYSSREGENEYNMQNEIKRTIQDTSNILMICIRRPFSFLATGAIITGS